MTRKRHKALTETEVDEIGSTLIKERNSQRRKLRAARNKATNELLYAETPKTVLDMIRTDLRQPKSNMKRIAREYGLPHRFILYLWTHHGP